MDGLMPALRKGDWFEFARYNSKITKVRQQYAAKCAAEASRAQERLIT
jgi:hypothetical protein